LIEFLFLFNLIISDFLLRAETNGNTKPNKQEFEILNIFPFTSETKRMGIIVRNKSTNEIIFYEKGYVDVREILLGNVFYFLTWISIDV